MGNSAITKNFVTGVENVPSPIVGDSKKFLQVNATEDGYDKKSIVEQIKGADVASAASITLGDDGNFFDITGTTGITSIIAKTAGTVITLQFDGVLTVTDGGNLKLNGNFTTVPESILALICDGVNWFEISRCPTTAGGLFVKSGEASRDLTLAPGTQVITGIGFQPVAISFRFGIDGDVGVFSWSFTDGTNQRGFMDDSLGGTSDHYGLIGNRVGFLQTSGGNSAEATLQSMDADGFTISWTKTANPVGSAVIQYLAFA